jgi:hypothetical protein
MSQAQIEKHQKTNEWVKFCKTKVEKIEKVWNRKLEDSTDDAVSDEESKPEQGSDDEDNSRLSHEDLVSKMLENIGNRNRNMLSRSHVELRKGDKESLAMAEIVASNLAADRESKDDTDNAEADLKDKEFANNNYWRLESTEFDLDELMAEAGM